jgi:hypothetical protein
VEVSQKSVCLVTYCARDKNPASGLMPAGERYLSSRIRETGEAAATLKVRFLILSGLYGLLDAAEPIPNYDHLLTIEQVPAHADLLAGQLAEKGVGKVVFVSRSLATDPGVGPYREAIGKACAKIGVCCHILEMPDSDSVDLAEMIDPLLV